jgi:hypothetical protein
MSSLTLTTHNETDKSTIDTFVKEKPVLGFNEGEGHWMVLTDTINDGYAVNDPFWYNTKTTDDTADNEDHVQDYDDSIKKAVLIEHGALKPVQALVEFILSSPAELLLIDEKGRRLGYDSDTGNYMSEIPSGAYDRASFIADPANPAPIPHLKKHLMVTHPQGSFFTLSVIGTGDGVYNLSSLVSDGKGNMAGDNATRTTAHGHVHEYYVFLDVSDGVLPPELATILAHIPASHQKKFIQAFRVIAGHTAKDHIVAKNAFVNALIRYVEKQYTGESWVGDVVAKLTALIT